MLVSDIDGKHHQIVYLNIPTLRAFLYDLGTTDQITYVYYI